MNFRRSSYLSSKQNHTGSRFTAAVTKILRWMFLLLLCLSGESRQVLRRRSLTTNPDLWRSAAVFHLLPHKFHIRTTRGGPAQCP
jgi:hypothetical protein